MSKDVGVVFNFKALPVFVCQETRVGCDSFFVFCLCRFFFKIFCADLQMEILEEYSDESAVLPLIQGKIIGRVEKVST